MSQPNTMTGPTVNLRLAVAALYEQVLEVSEVTVEDEFFVLGGNSLTAMRLLERIRAEFGVTVTAGAFYRATTVADLAELVRDLRGAGEAT